MSRVSFKTPRLNRSVPASTGPAVMKSQLSKQGVPAGECQKHHLLRASTTPTQGSAVDTGAGVCGKTFCANTDTPYHRLQHRRATFDEVVTRNVEGLTKSAIARVKRIASNTLARSHPRDSVSMRPSHQDACERSHGQGRTKRADRRCVAIGRDVARTPRTPPN